MSQAFALETGEAPDFAPLSYLVEQGLGERAGQRHLDDVRTDLLARLERKRKKATRAQKGLDQREAASQLAERVQQDGELVKTELHRLKRGMTSVEVVDYFGDGEPRSVSLDPKLAPQENLKRLFARARKLERARAAIQLDRERLNARVENLETLLEQARAASSTEALEELEAGAIASGSLDPRQTADPRKKKPPAARLPYRVFHTQRGTEVRVGRSARDNDALTFRRARGNDLWLHTADSPGSHVVLRLEKGTEADPEDLIDAALLALHFSPLREASRADVHIAHQKEVHKPRGAKPGLVTLSGGRNLHVRSQPERLARLLRSKPLDPSAPSDPA